MSPLRLSIGMATYRDFDGVFFSINSLRLYHADVIERCEFVVVDNDPDGPQADRLRDFLNHVAHGAMYDHHSSRTVARPLPQPFNVQYVLYNGAIGTSAPRDLIFQRASGDAVLVIDSHVQIWPNGVSKLLDYFDSHLESTDLLQGPLVMDSLTGAATHFDDVWRGGMWGTWGTAWKTPDGQMVSPRESSDHHVDLFDLLTNDFVKTLPVGWAGHEARLPALGYELALHSDEPFPIPAQGLGLFSCRRDAWLGFNPHFREFGGEEWYIHEKYRLAGRQCLCLPWLQWIHRFSDPSGGRQYPRSTPAKVRNYVLGHLELGMPLERVRKHFVDNVSEDPAQPDAGGGRIDTAIWESIVGNPAAYPLAQPTKASAAVASNSQLTLEDLFRHASETPSDIHAHCRKLRELASQCDTVVEFGHRPEVSTVALLAGQPKHLYTYALTEPDIYVRLRALMGRTVFESRLGDSLGSVIPECDLLFIDTEHNAARLWKEFERHAQSANRYIVLHDTQIYGTRGDDGSEGLLSAIRRLVTECPEWAVVYHTGRNHGLTVLSRRSSDRPARPIRLWSASHGPGTELKGLLATLGIHSSPSCDCNAKARQMDDWGADGCRLRFDQLTTWLREGQSRWGWRDKLAAAGRAVSTGLAFKINPLDPMPSLIEEAIRRAEAKESFARDSLDHAVG